MAWATGTQAAIAVLVKVGLRPQKTRPTSPTDVVDERVGQGRRLDLPFTPSKVSSEGRRVIMNREEKIKKMLGEQPEGMGRRRFFSIVGWGSLLSSLAISIGAAVRFAFPNDLLEPDTRYKIGRPEDFPEGITFLPNRRLFVFKEKAGFRAMSAVCTHLGCTVKRFDRPDEHKPLEHSHCPCHGSIFDREGNVLKGPAPRPLESYQISLSPTGEMVVDQRKKVSAREYLQV